jgi:uncharacterized protein YmfQ (DUF2313 family)
MPYTASHYAQQFTKLLCPGQALQPKPNGLLAGLIKAIAEEVAAWDLEAESLKADLNPITTVNYISEFEQQVGLPDGCLPTSGSLAQRRAAVVARIAQGRGNTKQDIIDIAALAGFQITIEEKRSFRYGESTYGDPYGGSEWGHTFVVKAPPTSPVRFRYGVSGYGDSYVDSNNDPLECLINKIKLAHLIAEFDYSGDVGSSSLFDGALGSLAGLKYFGDPDSLALDLGDSVASFTDFSINANHITQPESNRRPLLVLPESINYPAGVPVPTFGGKRALYFDGNDDFGFIAPDAIPSGNSSFSIYLLVNNLEFSGKPLIYMGSYSDTSPTSFVFNAFSEAFFNTQLFSAFVSGFAVQGGAGSNTYRQWGLVSLRYDAATTTAYLNYDAASGSFAASAVLPAPLNIDAAGYNRFLMGSNYGQNVQGLVGFLGIYHAFHSNVTQASVVTTLNAAKSFL